MQNKRFSKLAGEQQLNRTLLTFEYLNIPIQYAQQFWVSEWWDRHQLYCWVCDWVSDASPLSRHRTPVSRSCPGTWCRESRLTAPCHANMLCLWWREINHRSARLENWILLENWSTIALSKLITRLNKFSRNLPNYYLNENNSLCYKEPLFVHLTLIFDCRILYTFFGLKKVVWFITKNYFDPKNVHN